MKQTSLTDSWIRHPPGYQPREPSERKVRPTRTTPLAAIYSRPIPGSSVHFDTQSGQDDEDRLLTNAFDAYTYGSNFPFTRNDEASGSSVQADQDESLLNKLRSRAPISYRPTRDDSDELEGFDRDAGQHWLYPVNAALREYQFHITEQCLYKNTLVCLPTGLGKTFIAAVTMFNFLRWYPQGKVVFMAPTRPLVAQQLAACRQLIDLPLDTVIELNGSIPQSRRRQLWTCLRCFFLTPQVLANDLQSEFCPSSQLRLLIFDEAHKATGNHAYCQVLRLLTGPPHEHRQFRIIALSATPASDIQGVQTVIANLLISHLELRTDSSIDVKRYTKDRHIETVVVPLGPTLTHFRRQLVDCARPPLERLQSRGALRSGIGDLRPDRVAKYTVVKARSDWSSKLNSGGGSGGSLSSVEYGATQSDFGVLISLLHAIELLDQHGLRPLNQYLTGILSGQRASASVRAELFRVTGLKELLSDLSTRFPDHHHNHTSSTSLTQIPFFGGHPKLEKLRELLEQHFRRAANPDGTRVIVFSQFRDSVDEIMHMLVQLRPLIKPASFVGQSSGRSHKFSTATSNSSPTITSLPPSGSSGGISQRDQIRVMQEFRSGLHNTLVSTCIGEEGLDVGQVDLIVCFDAFKSPIRLMQRFGRTGRSRVGRIVMLLTEGREERNHAVSMSRSNLIHKSLLEGAAYKRLSFYPHNPRMIPLGITPEVRFERIDVSTNPDSENNYTVPKDSEHRSRRQLDKMKILTHQVSTAMAPLDLNLDPIGPLKLLSIHDMDDSIALRRCATGRYNFTSPDRLHTMRDSLQAQRSGCSASSTRHLMAVLRLIELHRKGLTQLTFHAFGLRSIDVDVPLSSLLGEAYVGSNTQTQSERPSNKTQPIDETKEYGFNLPDKKSLQPSTHNGPFLYLPLPVVKGLVSLNRYFPVSLDETSLPTAIDLLTNLNFSTENPSIQLLTLTGLQKAWANQLETLFEHQPVSSLPLNNSPPTTCDLASWIDHSLLEAIESNIQKTKHPGKHALSSIMVDTFNHEIDKPANGNDRLAAAFCLNSPRHLRASLFARSTSTPARKTASTSQVNLSTALALLDGSSTRLDTSHLLDGSTFFQSKQQNLNETGYRSAIFTGSTYAKGAALEFRTKLSLGDDFGTDFLSPTQPFVMEQPIMSEQIQLSQHNSPRASNIDVVPFSQINWSPVSLNSFEHEVQTVEQQTEATIAGSQSIYIPSSENGSSRPIRSKNNRKTRIVPTARRFLLSQVDESGRNTTDSGDEFSSHEIDCYENSFIDDVDEDATKLDKSSMMGIYLRSIKSPSIGKHASYYPGKHPIETCILGSSNILRAHTKSLNVTNGHADGVGFIYSQVPDSEDHYELDSFCVDDSDSDANMNKEALTLAHKPRKRRRLIVTDSD